MSRTDSRTQASLRSSRAQAGIERREHFARPGATSLGWRGGPHTVQRDQRREASRQACRGQVEQD